jgi:hypothetical protein
VKTAAAVDMAFHVDQELRMSRRKLFSKGEVAKPHVHKRNAEDE